jgi:3-oxoadipate enol-lactonase
MSGFTQPVSYESGGARLSYLDIGSGTPVVFLHPTPLDHDYWRPLAGELHRLPSGEQVRAIIPDLRGHGGSELGGSLPRGGFERVPDAAVLSMHQLAMDVLALLDDLHVPAAVFVGCSVGGYVLLELWRQAPERMRGLAFICSKPQPDAEPALIKRAANIAIARESGVAALFDGMANLLIGESSRTRRPEMVAECRARMTLTAEAFVAVQAGLAARPDSLPTVQTMHNPVLAIAGGEDGAVAPADMEAFRVAPGGCEYHLLPDAGHFAAYEQPQIVAGILAGWLLQFAD